MPHPIVAAGLVTFFDDHGEAIRHQGLQQVQAAAAAHDGEDGQLRYLRIDELRHLPRADIFVFIIGFEPFGGAVLVIGITKVRQRVGQRGGTAIVPALIFVAQTAHAEGRRQRQAGFVGLRGEGQRPQIAQDYKATTKHVSSLALWLNSASIHRFRRGGRVD